VEQEISEYSACLLKYSCNKEKSTTTIFLKLTMHLTATTLTIRMNVLNMREIFTCYLQTLAMIGENFYLFVAKLVQVKLLRCYTAFVKH